MKVPDNVEHICRTLQELGYQAYVVGGSVRDSVMGKKPKDWDIATSAAPHTVQGIFARTIPLGIQFGTVGVLVDGQVYEVTTFRTEGNYEDGRHPHYVEWTDLLFDDLARRDFSMNAMAWDPITQVLIDPFNGKGAIERKVISTVGEPNHRFQEDGLRILRALRFMSQLGFSIDEDTLLGISTCLSTLNRISVERIREEFVKILVGKHVGRALRMMTAIGIWPYVCREFAETVGIEQNKHHDFTVDEHIIHAVESIEPYYLLRLTMFFHDIGKPRVREPKGDGYSFLGHDAVSVDIAQEVMTRLKFPNYDIEYVCHLVKNHMNWGYEKWSNAAVRRFIRRIGKYEVDRWFAVHVADQMAHRVGGISSEKMKEIGEFSTRVNEMEDAPVEVRDLAINGHEIMEYYGLKPGPEVGVIINDLMELVLDDPEMNDKGKLLEYLKEKYLDRQSL